MIVEVENSFCIEHNIYQSLNLWGLDDGSKDGKGYCHGRFSDKRDGSGEKDGSGSGFGDKNGRGNVNGTGK